MKLPARLLPPTAQKKADPLVALLEQMTAVQAALVNKLEPAPPKIVERIVEKPVEVQAAQEPFRLEMVRDGQGWATNVNILALSDGRILRRFSVKRDYFDNVVEVLEE